MTRHVLFVTTELEPDVPGGGAGVVVARLLDGLHESGHQARAVVVTEAPVDREAVIRVQPGRGEPTNSFIAASRSAAEAVSELVSASRVDIVEFQDFEGLAFWALAHRQSLGLDGTLLAVRVHGPIGMLAEHLAEPPADLDVVDAMEREVLAMADALIVPSRPIGPLIAARYGIDRQRILTGQPPLAEIPRLRPGRSAHPEVVCLGRLAEVKGSADFLEAALPLLEAEPGLRLRFVGDDGWSTSAGRPMREWLRSMVPEGLSARVRFDDHISRETWVEELAGAWLIVIPSHFETFCLAAHEARAAGFPVMLADLPAYRDYFGEATGAFIYDGTPGGLRSGLRRLLSDETTLDRLASAPGPSYSDPLEPYLGRLPEIRHRQAQAGLGTAAVNRLESAVTRLERPKTGAGLARSLLRILPAPIARLAARVLPRFVKDRFRRLASWPEEEQRRREEARRSSVERRLASGELQVVAGPEVSVVVPCFNQGQYLIGALVSVHEQDFESWEIIVVDDGSDDRATIETIEGLDFPRVKVIRQANAGLAAARNVGIKASRGHFVVSLDADDELLPGFLTELRAELAADPGAAFAHCWARLFGDVNAVWATRPYNDYQLLMTNSVAGCVMLRRQAWEAVGGYDETMRRGNEDWELWVRLLGAGWGQRQVRRPLFAYRRRGISMSVDTESRFEEGRTAIVARHPDIYERERMRRLKRDHYPLVSVAVLAGSRAAGLEHQDLDDIEVIEEASPSAAVRRAKGKYVVHWPFGKAPPGSLRELATALEAEPKAIASGPGGEPLMWRRWALLDPDAPHAGVANVPLGAMPSDSPFVPGGYPDPEWRVPAVVDGLPTQRQPPEVEGFLPDWVV